MFTFARLAPAFVAAALTLVPVAAFAGGKDQATHQKVQLPMKADEYNQLVEKQIAKMQAGVDKHLAKSKKMTDEQRAAVKKQVETGVAEIRAAASKAEADGTVTKEESAEVRAAMRKLHGSLPHHKHAKK